MRWLLALCVVLFGCETIYFGAPGADGGALDMGYTDEFGEYIEDTPNLGIFRSESKLQGNAILQLVGAPVVPAANAPWPDVLDTPQGQAGSQTLIDLSTKDDKPHVVTVSLGVGKIPYPAGSKLVDLATEVVAILDIGIGGVAYRVEVDYLWGTQFSFAASRLQLHAVFRVVNNGSVAGTGGTVIFVPGAVQVQVGASVATGVVAHGRQPQRTLTHKNVAIGRYDTWNIPRFAKSCVVESWPQNAQIDFNIQTISAQCAQVPIVASPSPEIMIPASADNFYVGNAMPATVITQYNIVCDLAF